MKRFPSVLREKRTSRLWRFSFRSPCEFCRHRSTRLRRWSRRVAVFGGDHARLAAESALDPARDPARIRAFFVHPDWARRGIGRAILSACEEAIRAAGFYDAVLVATRAGEPLYAAFGYTVADRHEVPLSGGLKLPVVRMVKSFNPISQFDLPKDEGKSWTHPVISDGKLYLRWADSLHVYDLRE